MKQIDCWYYDVAELADPVRFARGMDALPWEERRQRVLRYRFEKDRRLCLGAGLLAAYALRRAGAADLRLSCSEYGKPMLSSSPGICFNLSHSGTLAVCAVSDRPVGVDVEALAAFSPEVASACFRPDELAWLERQADRDLAFTRLWTRKESRLKHLGTGLSLPANSFSVLPGEAPAEGIALTEYAVEGHRICVCARADREVAFRAWRSGL